jgi:hypothetical protein
MTEVLQKYIDTLTGFVLDKISNYFLKNNNDLLLINEHFTCRLKSKQFRDFQEYYFKTLNNQELVFKEFRQKYSLQGIDRLTLQRLDDNKNEIFNLIKSDNISELYFKFFTKVKIPRKDKIIEKNLGSFFTKIVHTFRPTEYTPLDMPLRNFFGLNDESYLVSCIIVSNAYKLWTADKKNRVRVESLKKHLYDICKNKSLAIDKISDMRLLNLIFWSVADNERKKKGSR